MKIRAIINEASPDKANNLLDRLSSDDLIVALFSLTDDIVDESSDDMAKQKQEGKRIYGGSENFIAYDDESRTGQRFKETPAGLEVTNVQYKPDNDTRRGATFNAPSQAEIKSAMKQDGVSRNSPKKMPAPIQSPPVTKIKKPELDGNDLEKFVSSVSKADKEKLIKLLQSEIKERKIPVKKAAVKNTDLNTNLNDFEPEPSKPKAKPKAKPKEKSSHTGKFIALTLAALLTYILEPEFNQTNITEPFELSNATYTAVATKNASANKNVIVYIGKREGSSGTTYAIYAFNAVNGTGVHVGGPKDFDTYRSAEEAFNKELDLGGEYELRGGSSQYNYYSRIKRKLGQKERDKNVADAKARTKVRMFNTYMNNLVADDPEVTGWSTIGSDGIRIHIKMNDPYGLEHNGYTDAYKRAVMRDTGATKVEFDVLNESNELQEIRKLAGLN